jgi:hypothetical protein
MGKTQDGFFGFLANRPQDSLGFERTEKFIFENRLNGQYDAGMVDVLPNGPFKRIDEYFF